MAWIFSLWVETELDSQKEEIVKYFNLRIIFVNGKGYVVKAFQSGMVTVDGISQYGITCNSDAEEMTAIGIELYKLLKLAPEFRYALCGVEIDGWRDFHELEEDPEDILLIPGFVIRKDIYEKLGSPGEFEEFSSNYLWTPYQGEQWIDS